MWHESTKEAGKFTPKLSPGPLGRALRSENLENRRGFYFSEIRISEKIAGGFYFFGKSPEKIAIWVFIYSGKKLVLGRFPL